MAGIDDTAEAMKAHDLKEALSRSKTLHISCSRPYNFRQKEGRSEVSGIKPESDDNIHGMQSLGELCIQSWSRTGDRTSLLLSSHSLPIIEVISILSKFCKQLQHLIFDAYRLDVSMHDIPANLPSRMESVLTVSLSCMVGSLVLEHALAFTAWCFPNASTLKVIGRIILKSSSVSKVKPTLDLEELVLTLEDNPTPSLGSLFNTVSTACGKLKRFHIDSDRKFPLHTLAKMISQLACPELELLKLSQAKISLDKIVALDGVSWQKSSERCELKLDRASAELPVMAVVSVVSRKLKEVTVLSLNECKVKLPEKIGVPQRKLREKTLIREINFLNMKNPVPAAHLQALFTINVTLRGPSPHDGADMVHKYRSAHEKSVEMPPPAKKSPHPSLALADPKCFRQLPLDFERKLDRKQTSSSTQAHIHARKRERTSQEKQTNGIPASFTDRKAPVQPNGQEEIHFSQLDPEERLDKEQTSTATPAHMHARKRERTSQEKQTNGIPASFTEEKAPSKQKCVRKLQLDPEENLDEEQTSTSTPANMHARKNERTSQGRPTHTITVGKAELKCLGNLQLDPEGKLDEEQTSTSTPAHIRPRKRKRTSQEKQTSSIPASNTEGKAPSKQECVRKLQLDPEGSLDEEQTSTSTPTNIHARRNERTSQGRPTHTITEGEAPSKRKCVRKLQLDPEGGLDKEQTSTSTPTYIHARKNERTLQGRQTHIIPEGKAPSELKCERKLHCLPFVPQKIPQKPKCIILRVHLCDDVKGNMERVLAEERKLGYIPSHAEMDVLIIPAKRNLKLKCRVNSSQQEQTKHLSYDRISGSPHNCVPFKVEYKSKSDVVFLKVGQLVKLEVEIFFSINDVGDHRDTSNASLPYEGQGTSTASCATRDTVRQGQEVTHQQIAKLATRLRPDVCIMLCQSLGFEYNFVHQIIKEHQGNYKAACEDILHQWKDDTGGPVELLDKALVSCRLGGLISRYKEKE